MWICFKDVIPEPPSFMIGNDEIERTNSFKLLGVWIQDNLKWNTHIEEITKKANKRLFFSWNVAEKIYRLKWTLHVMKQKLDLYWNMRMRYGAVCHNILTKR